MTKKFVLVSLQEKKAKKLAEVISNNTCRKILDYMSSKKDVTESELSKHLKIPLSTVHYNMKALMSAKLAKSDEYHYSEKGKEVSHYRLANQYVIIAPEEDKKLLREKLKSILPIALVTGAAASIIKLFSGVFFGATKMSADSAVFSNAGVAMPAAAKIAPMVAEEAGSEIARVAVGSAANSSINEAASVAADYAVDDGARQVVHKAAEPLTGAMPPSPTPAPIPKPSILHYAQAHIPEILFWFIVGALIGLGIYFLVSYFKSKHRKRIEIRVKPPKK